MYGVKFKVANAPQTLDGWFCLHSLYRVDWPLWQALADSERDALLAEADALMAGEQAKESDHS